MGRKKILICICSLVLFSLAVYSFAQETETPSGPTESEIEGFAAEFGAPPEAFSNVEVEPAVTSEEPGTVPVEAKEALADSEFVKIYCAMTRWKSGSFFSALEAVDKYVTPAVEKVKILGIEVAMPDIAALKAEGENRLTAICAAATADEAERLAKEFKTWGETSGRGKLTQFRQELMEKIKAKGDELRAKIKIEVDNLVATEKAAIESEIRAKADELAAAKQAEIEAAKPQSAEEAEQMVSSARAEIDREINALVAEKKAELEKKIKAKADEIAGTQSESFTAIRKDLDGLSADINSFIRTDSAKYEVYKEEAMALRQEAILKTVDAKITSGLAELDKFVADIEEAKKEDPKLMGADEIKSNINRDRTALEANIKAALAAGNEAALETALSEFRKKWEGYRAETEKAQAQSVAKICTTALAKLQGARSQLNANIEKIKKLEAKCGASASDECLEINSFADRFATIKTKSADLLKAMDMLDGLCQNAETADRNNVTALLNKLKADGEDLKLYGEALEAEKKKAVSGSLKDVCAKALSPLKAGLAEMEKNDLVVIGKNLDKCQKKTDPECVAVNKLTKEHKELQAKVTKFKKDKAQAEEICLGEASETNLEKIGPLLKALKTEGEEARKAAKVLAKKQAALASAKSFCRAALGEINMAKNELALGIKELAEVCAGQDQCETALSAEINGLKTEAETLYQAMAGAEQGCAAAGDEKPADTLINSFNDIAAKGTTLKEAIAKLKAAQQTYDQ